MQFLHFKSFKPTRNDNQGFSLLEVMVVMIIVAILATGVVFMFANPSARVKGQAFTMLGELNMARSEAVNRNLDVRVTFLPGATAADQDGYRIWIDDWDATTDDFGSDDTYASSASGSDTLIRETFFPEEVQFYDANATNGPNIKPYAPWDALDMADSAPNDTDNDGIEFDADDEFVFTLMGTAEDSGSDSLDNVGYVIIYYPKSSADHATMRAAPYALVVSTSVGTISIVRWNIKDTAWLSK
jgi:prepilin-type N-terminal cleavage/methylation domain-containing protein